MNETIKIIAQVFSYLGTVTTLSMLLPQLIKILVTKQTSSLSMSMYVISTFNGFFWFLYGFLETFILKEVRAGLPVLISNFFSLITSATILTIILLDNKKIKQIQSNKELYLKYLEKEQAIFNLRFEFKKSFGIDSKEERKVLTKKLNKEIKAAEINFAKFEILIKKRDLEQNIRELEKEEQQQSDYINKITKKGLKSKESIDIAQNINYKNVDEKINNNNNNNNNK